MNAQPATVTRELFLQTSQNSPNRAKQAHTRQRRYRLQAEDGIMVSRV